MRGGARTKRKANTSTTYFYGNLKIDKLGGEKAVEKFSFGKSYLNYIQRWQGNREGHIDGSLYCKPRNWGPSAAPENGEPRPPASHVMRQSMEKEGTEEISSASPPIQFTGILESV